MVQIKNFKMQKFKNLKSAIDYQLKYHLSEKLLRFFKKYTVVFQVLEDIILEDPAQAEKVFNDPDELEFRIRSTCKRLYKKARNKLRRSVVRVIIYIFITKMLLVLLIELPYERYIAQSVLYLPLIINALFPPVLMFLIGLFIKVPSKRNTNTIVKVAQQLVSSEQLKGVGGISKTVKRGAFVSIMFSILYILLLTNLM